MPQGQSLSYEIIELTQPSEERSISSILTDVTEVDGQCTCIIL